MSNSTTRIYLIRANITNINEQQNNRTNLSFFL